MKTRISLPVCILLILLAIFITCQYMNTVKLGEYRELIAELTEKTGAYSTIEEIDAIVKENYMYDIDEQSIMEGMIQGYIYGLGDKYAYYYSPEDFNEYTVENNGKMTGIGVRVIYDNTHGGIYIISVMPDSPALESGLRAGDIITAVDGQSIVDIGYYEAINRIKNGEEGTFADISIARGPDYSSVEDISIMRREIDNPTITAEMLESDIGLVKISEFNRTTSEELVNAVTGLVNEGAKKIVFDVRNNPGGDLIGVAGALDFILPEGPIIHVVSKEGVESTITSGKSELDIPMVVLINENTASAGELFCSALKDYGKAVLVGTKTYGKGSMQTIMQLSDGGGFSLTTNRYDPPYSENYDGIGVEPDIISEFTDEQWERYYQLTHAEDTQLQDAIKAFERFDEITALNNKHDK